MTATTPHVTTVYTNDGVVERSYCNRCRNAFTDDNPWRQLTPGLFVHAAGCQRLFDLDGPDFIVRHMLRDDTGRLWATDGHCVVAANENDGEHLPKPLTSPTLDVIVAKATNDDPVTLQPWRPDAQLPPLGDDTAEMLVRHRGYVCAVLERPDGQLTLIDERYRDLIFGYWPVSAFKVEQLGDQSGIVRVTELDGAVIAYAMPICDRDALAAEVQA